MLDYVSYFRDLQHACDIVRESLSATQCKIKANYNKKAVTRNFQLGDRVLVLMPVIGFGLHARFSGPCS